MSDGATASAEALSRDAVCGLQKHGEARVRESGRRCVRGDGGLRPSCAGDQQVTWRGPSPRSKGEVSRG